MLRKLVAGCTAWALPAWLDTDVFGSWLAAWQLLCSSKEGPQRQVRPARQISLWSSCNTDFLSVLRCGVQ